MSASMRAGRAPRQVMLTVTLDDPHAQALAQFLKRVGWSEMRGCAVDDTEAYLIREALSGIQEELRENGYSPR